ncbi:ABC transporter ATP-binding protein [Corynebacterium mastitidis]|uniref:Peptide ABC transporter ATP-binding protein n=1 Tax=Corynebacterium mastitidis TaxID=161890 RepID=A0A2N0XAK3_9CORY|nr:ABC transporter ATP-binding protein [Corynebacterium mastitidis]MCH6196121.1 ABC transporter ATP-binding protein [Corynebacterium mastitidis]PKF69730.1 peptide ABC transporter ATP-binding protein [Corynebacterium mastitidis]
MNRPVLSVQDLRVIFPSESGPVQAVRGLSFDLSAGRTLGIVGESGSGKSVASLAIMGLLPDYASVTGSVFFQGQELLGTTDKEMSAIRGSGISMVFQDPLSALTPVFSIGAQLVEAIKVHQQVGAQRARESAMELLDLVGIPEPRKHMGFFPHQFSGGMRQRVVIAMAIANNPAVLIADEPTTALDVTIQAQILDVLKVAQRETGAATIMITHDMGVVAQMADEVLVMYAGTPVEHGSAEDVFHRPRMPYTVGLLGSTPRIDATHREPLIPIQGSPPTLISPRAQCHFAPRCPVALPECSHTEPRLRLVEDGHRAACLRSTEIAGGTIDGKPMYPRPVLEEDLLRDVPRDRRETILEVNNLHKSYPIVKGAVLKRRVGTKQAIKGISFEVKQGECFAIVGESGSGKTTTLTAIMDLKPTADSTIKLRGDDVAGMSPRQRKAARRDIQIVFQDPLSSLNPRMTVKDLIAEPLITLGYPGDIPERVRELMELVNLGEHQLDRFPGHFSGGQRQRIGLARALATNPSLIVLDEPVSALDVSVQAGIINLLDNLRRKLGLSYVFVSHDLSVVRHLSDRVAIMRAGEFVEVGETEAIFSHPSHPYTRALLSAIPIPDPSASRSRQE